MQNYKKKKEYEAKYIHEESGKIGKRAIEKKKMRSVHIERKKKKVKHNLNSWKLLVQILQIIMWSTFKSGAKSIRRNIVE